MIPVLEIPAVRARVSPFSVESYHLLFELGALAPNAELIRGAIVEKMPKAPLHASVVENLRDALALWLPGDYILRQEQPLTLADSEPEPDLAVVAGKLADYRRAHPQTAALVVEVAISSEALDRLKLEIYAEAGVPECWLILPEQQTFERHTEPQNATYRRVERVTFPQTLASTVFPAFRFLPPGVLTE